MQRIRLPLKPPESPAFSRRGHVLTLKPLPGMDRTDPESTVSFLNHKCTFWRFLRLVGLVVPVCVSGWVFPVPQTLVFQLSVSTQGSDTAQHPPSLRCPIHLTSQQAAKQEQGGRAFPSKQEALGLMVYLHTQLPKTPKGSCFSLGIGDISIPAWAKALALEWDEHRNPKDALSPGQAKDNPVVIKLLPSSLTTWKLFGIMAAKLDLSQGQGDGKEQLGRDQKERRPSLV